MDHIYEQMFFLGRGGLGASIRLNVIPGEKKGKGGGFDDTHGMAWKRKGWGCWD